MQYTIPAAFDGMLLRTYLQQEIKLSHRLLTRLKQTQNGILLNNVPVTVRAVLHTDDSLSLATEDPARSTDTVPGGDMPPVLYEDRDILVCNKPGNMPTHPSHGHLDDTLANAVAAYDIRQCGHAHIFRPITRLDRETSGAVLVARTQLAAARLSTAMEHHLIQKTYLAVLEDLPVPPSGTVEVSIHRARESIILREVCRPDAEGAQVAITHYRVLAAWQDGALRRSLVEASPETGRTHQLRLHFAHLGTPIAGDGLYGRSDVPPSRTPPRQCLHAYMLTFLHPTTGKRTVVTAPLPDDMAAYLPDNIRNALPSLLAKQP